MLPTDVQNIIDSYVAQLDEYGDLPSLKSFQRLIRRCDDFVIGILGDVLREGTGGHLRYRLTSPSYIFHFNFSHQQRDRMLYLLERAITGNVHISSSVWATVGPPMLCRYPEYMYAFAHGFFCKLLVRLQP